MILLDTNVLIYAFAPESPFHVWARGVIADHVSAEGVVINAVCLAELCVGDADPGSAADRIRSYGVSIVDVPAACAAPAAAAYQRYLENRKSGGHGPISRMPLPDFFIGAHAMAMNWQLATADQGRFGTYFPSLQILKPPQS
jgi:predicted nucleic acid-binding protein